MKTNYQKVMEFHQKFDPDVSAYKDLLRRRVEFLQEEVRETLEAVQEVRDATSENKKIAMAHLVKELVDVLYITYGTLELLKVDADAAFAEVHKSNMSKTPNPSGKAIKGEGYHPAQMEKFVV